MASSPITSTTGARSAATATRTSSCASCRRCDGDRRGHAMNVRSQIASVFHLDKCLGCHTCSVACKNVWTNRKGAEYMWWNNVETKPGTGYPTAWEDQGRYRGGWERRGETIGLKSTSRLRIIGGIFHQPHMPTMD